MDELEIYNRLGELVHQHRERLGMSQVQLGNAIGLSRASIANIETGRQRIPLHHLFRLAKALQVDAHTLLPNLSRVSGTVATRKIQATIDLSEQEQAAVARVVRDVENSAKSSGS